MVEDVILFKMLVLEVGRTDCVHTVHANGRDFRLRSANATISAVFHDTSDDNAEKSLTVDRRAIVSSGFAYARIR